MDAERPFVLLDSAYIRVERFRESGVIFVRRKLLDAPAAETRTAEVVAAYLDALTLAAQEHRGWGLVVDVRAVSGRNDEDFESQMRPVRALAEAAFAEVVILVRTTVGRLQVNRLLQADSGKSQASLDEADAIARAAGSGGEERNPGCGNLPSAHGSGTRGR